MLINGVKYAYKIWKSFCEICGIKKKKCVDEDNQPEENVIYFSVLLGNMKKSILMLKVLIIFSGDFYFCFPTTDPVHYV